MATDKSGHSIFRVIDKQTPSNAVPGPRAPYLAERTSTADSGLSVQTGHHAVCTVAEGNYFYGAAALANSLVRAGFRGSIIVGYRGARPAWIQALKKESTPDVYLVAPEVRLQLVEIPGTWHLSNCKAYLIQQIFQEIIPSVDLVYCLDSDIVITTPWSTLVEWAGSGVVVALDMADSYMSPHHVYRHAWRALAGKIDRKCRDFTGYVNGGCVGINRQFKEFAELWALLMKELEREGADMTKMKNWTGRPEFARMDQDVLNATMMTTDTPIALLGAEAMGWFPATGEVMPHAMLHKKPWVRNYILDALRGFPPDRAHRAYWRFVEGPIRPFGEWDLKRKKAALTMASTIGRFHTRSYRDLYGGNN
jgi:hypothetical protein